ncbi:gonadotropin-releasing hormone receptor-like [Tropilaelaps mercedesae]|uniref:Gonadotropin-releasing hormone receptor-like n=1 Tax=Tropilaelaps mercedesae TaxID=418985 RepID=A0A1V9Y0T0_9ACAR|nr:gonadotropin-releasing hormone receptor-like [Tropilaelaps mercedesae]
MDYPTDFVRKDEKSDIASWCAWLPNQCNALINATDEMFIRGRMKENVVSFGADSISEAPQLTRWVLVRAVILASIGSVSLAANGAALASICRQRTRRGAAHVSSLYTLLAHMAAADLLVAAFCLLAEAAWTYTVAWLADDSTCKLVKYAQLFALYLSTYILLVLGLDQLLIVRYPLRKEANGLLVRRAIWAAWALAAIFALPQVHCLSSRTTGSYVN